MVSLQEFNIRYIMSYVNHITRNVSGLMVSKSDFKSSGPRSFPGKGKYEFAFQL